jgi:branched-chain amino acid transport system ATP-binding protein
LEAETTTDAQTVDGATPPDPAVSPAPVAAPSSGQPILEVKNLRGGYGRRPVLFDVSLDVRPGEIVALLGHNGAGKSTTLKLIAGLLRSTGGKVFFESRDVTHHSCADNVRRGISLVPQDRAVFRELTVRDNILLGATTVNDGDLVDQREEEVYTLFPILRERTSQVAGTLSGGQQRMLSVGMALMAGPKALLLDEPSLGLAPAVVESLMDTVRMLARGRGIAVLLVEQNIPVALKEAERVLVMRTGRIVLEESSEKMAQRENLWELW